MSGGGLEILVSRRPGETRTGLFSADGRPLAFLLDRDGVARPGSIHRGRVISVAGNAVFVDLATGETGFLPWRKGPPPTQGAAVTVQVTRAAAPGKGPELTADVALKGTLVVMTPNRPGVAVSKAVAGKDARAALQEAAENASAPGEGWVVRTAAGGASRVAIAAEMVRLRARWDGFAEDTEVPTVLDVGPPAAAALAEDANVSTILCDDEATFQETRAQLNHLIDRVLLFGGRGRDEALFERHEAEDAWDAALEPVVALPSGGRLIIEPTAALTAVDVDAGGAPVPATNAEAVTALARQLRLRNLSGQILLDLIPGKGAGSEAIAVLKAAVAEDPVPTVVHGRTRLGFIEITRERRWLALHELTGRPTIAPTVETTALAALDAARRHAGIAEPVTLRCHPWLAGRFDGPLAGAVAEVEKALAGGLKIDADPAMPVHHFEIVGR